MEFYIFFGLALLLTLAFLYFIERQRELERLAVAARFDSYEKIIRLAFATSHATSAGEVVAAAQALDEEPVAPEPRKATPVGVRIGDDELHFLTPVSRSLLSDLPESRIVREEE